MRDRARADGSTSEGKASIAASGFALSAWAVATQRGWVIASKRRPPAAQIAGFLAEKAPRRHGFFYHFMEMDTGARAWKCEVSPIDTGLFFAGAILAREYFGDPEITTLVNGLIRDVDWEWFLNGGQTLSMAWHDEQGFSRYRWDKYAEDMMLSFLGMGAVERPLPVAYWDDLEADARRRLMADSISSRVRSSSSTSSPMPTWTSGASGTPMQTTTITRSSPRSPSASSAST